MDNRETVVVTGFGPFREFLVNPSWKAAQALTKAGLGETFCVRSREVPVSYAAVQRIIPELWETLNPKLAVHLGMSRGSGVVLLEQTGRNSDYRDMDVCRSCPQSHRCVGDGPEELDSIIDMKVISKHFRRKGSDVLYSRDAGRYLCDFAYYCSLYHGRQRAAFIHLPTSGGQLSTDRLVPLLQSIVLMMLQQLHDHEEGGAAGIHKRRANRVKFLFFVYSKFQKKVKYKKKFSRYTYGDDTLKSVPSRLKS